jgi:hypothetical protein
MKRTGANILSLNGAEYGTRSYDQGFGNRLLLVERTFWENRVLYLMGVLALSLRECHSPVLAGIEIALAHVERLALTPVPVV